MSYDTIKLTILLTLMLCAMHALAGCASASDRKAREATERRMSEQLYNDLEACYSGATIGPEGETVLSGNCQWAPEVLKSLGIEG